MDIHRNQIYPNLCFLQLLSGDTSTGTTYYQLDDDYYKRQSPWSTSPFDIDTYFSETDCDLRMVFREQVR